MEGFKFSVGFTKINFALNLSGNNVEVENFTDLSLCNALKL